MREEIERPGVAGRTLLVYMSDSGYLHGEHGLIDKRVMHEPSIRVPLLMECHGLQICSATSSAGCGTGALNDSSPTLRSSASMTIFSCVSRPS